MRWSAAELVTSWWAGRLGPAGVALDAVTAPAEWGYRAAVAARNFGFQRGLLPVARVNVPVSSVGYLTVGGSGKTPVAAWLLRGLRARGRRPALLHGGYAEDEPELHRRWAPGLPVVAMRDRVAGAARALALGADVLVLDDGFQHRRLGRDLDLLLVAAESWSERRRLLPRGGWREAAESARRAHLIVVTRRAASPGRAAAATAELARLAPDVPILRLRLRPAGWDHQDRAADAPVEPALAVAAVADPGSFLDNARTAGALLAGQLCWRDHHRYRASDAALILARAGDGPIGTTEKDWVKLERLVPAGRVWVLRQEVLLEAGERELQAALDGVLRG
ncbi:MAG: tetraacyldisaccharide 4'-kinase [Gemmatimonadetes bacterium]|nr:tetraacyldisaccharide 4'-kinase [Gemmatimonadota bacterium]